jgi:hypothetical protein
LVSHSPWLLAQTAAHGGHASEPNYQLTWQAPADCPSGTEVSREIAELTAASASPRQVSPVVAHANVAKDAAGFTMTLTLRNAGLERSRHIGAPSCEELGHAAALIVALAVDPSLLERRAGNGESIETNSRNACHCRLTELPQSPLPQPPPLQPLVIQRPCPPQVVIGTAQTKINTASSAPLFWRLGVGVIATYRTLPGTNFGASVMGGFQTHRLRFDVVASMLSTTTYASTPGRSADLALYRFASRACWLFGGTNSWGVGPCASVELGLLSGKGHAADLATREQWGLWGASAFGGAAELRLSPSTLLSLSAELGIPWLRGDGFQLGGETVYQAQPSGTLGVGLLAGWP